VPDRLFVKVYFEDKHLIVAEKPAGVLTMPKKGSDASDFTQQVHKYLRRKHPGSRHSFLKPLHRLDRETSGVVVLAKSKAGEKLTQQFKNHTIQRNYLAIVYGALKEAHGVIDAALEKGSFGGGRKVRLAKGDKGKKARTEFRVKERYANASLLDISVATGRTHQIRIHLAWKSHPVIGDRVYGQRRDDAISFQRHALHAHKLSFRHPVTGEKKSFRSPLPKDMADLVDSLRTG
jgi:RluA family pseudouridine synthase